MQYNKKLAVKRKKIQQNGVCGEQMIKRVMQHQLVNYGLLSVEMASKFLRMLQGIDVF
jgi:hypothetical protein